MSAIRCRLKGDAYPIDLNLQIVGIYDGPSNRDLRMCLFRFDYLDEALKRVAAGRSRRSSSTTPDTGMSGNAGGDLHQMQGRRRDGRASAIGSTSFTGTATTPRAPRPRKPSARCSARCWAT